MKDHRLTPRSRLSDSKNRELRSKKKHNGLASSHTAYSPSYRHTSYQRPAIGYSWTYYGRLLTCPVTGSFIKWYRNCIGFPLKASLTVTVLSELLFSETCTLETNPTVLGLIYVLMYMINGTGSLSERLRNQ